MHIQSDRQSMIVTLDDGYSIFWWHGTHTANVFLDGVNVDCFTFAWHKNDTSQLDFTKALVSFLRFWDAALEVADA